VGNATVEDVGAHHATADGLRTRLDLGDHAAGRSTLATRSSSATAVAVLQQQGVGVVGDGAQPRHVGEKDELLGAECLGDGAGDGVGVDVVACPSSSAPMVATTGMRPWASSRLTGSGSTSTTSPT